jgi:hypothetical protein
MTIVLMIGAGMLGATAACFILSAVRLAARADRDEEFWRERVQNALRVDFSNEGGSHQQNN